RAFDVQALDALDLDLRDHFEYGAIFQVRALLQADRLDARAAGGLQFFLHHGFIEGGLHDIAQHFLTDLLTELLAHDFDRHLAWAEALQAYRPTHALQPRVHRLFDAFGRNLHFH